MAALAIASGKLPGCFGSMMVLEKDEPICSGCRNKHHCREDLDEARKHSYDRGKSHVKNVEEEIFDKEIDRLFASPGDDVVNDESISDIEKVAEVADRSDPLARTTIMIAGEEYPSIDAYGALLPELGYELPLDIEDSFTDYIGHDTDELCELLNVFVFSITREEYLLDNNREKYLAMHIAMNRITLYDDEIAKSPRFRPTLKVKWRNGGETFPLGEKFLSNDTQIIDLHWLHCRGRRHADDSVAKRVFAPDDFNFDEAEQFVVKKGKAVDKAIMIGLTLDEQWEVNRLHSESIRITYKEIEKQTKKIRQILGNIAKRNQHVRGNQEVWEKVYMAREIEKMSMMIKGEPKPTQVTRWYKLVTGKNITRQSMRQKMRSIHKYLREAKHE